MNAIPSTFRRNCLTATIASALMLAGGHAGARNLDGTSATVNAGEAAEAWRLDNNASLTVLPGGQTLNVSAFGSTINFAGASVVRGSSPNALQLNASTGDIVDSTIAGNTIFQNGSDVRIAGSTINGVTTFENSSGVIAADSELINASGRALALINLIGSRATKSVVTVSNSRIQGSGSGATVASGNTLTLMGSTVEATDDGQSGLRGGGYALGGFGGDIHLGAASRAVGARNGAILATDPRFGDPRTTSLTVDGSHLEGLAGPAILVDSIDVEGTEATINVVNGATLRGGNGTLLEVTGANKAGFFVDNSELTGNVVNSDTGLLDMTLRNTASLTGTLTNVSSLAMADSQWTITGDSDVGTLSLGNGTVAFQAPTTGDFKTLTINGDFSSVGGTLMFNAVLADDASGHDRLHIIGNTSGQANVQVKNVGGVGAQTVNGIKLIQVDGVSNGQFTLTGRAVGGQYDYFLFKGGKSDPNDGDWYLRSELQTPPNPCLADPSLPGCEIVIPDPCEIDPSLPQCGPIVPVLRPEPGAYLANLRAAEMMFRTDYHSRHDGQNHGRAWARVDGNRNSYDALNRQLDITGNSQALHVGLDLVTNEAGSGFGVMLASGNATSTTKSHLTDYSARGKVKGEALGVYGTIRALAGEDPYGGLYVDGWLQRQQFRNKVEGAGLSVERYDSKAWQGAVEAGYAFRLSGAPTKGGIYLEPQVQLGYTDISSDTHVEENGTIVEAQEAGGMFARTGLRLSGVRRWESMAAQVQPYLQANWLYNKRDEALLFDNELVDNRIPASKLEIGAGASIKFAGGLGVWAGLAVQSASGYRSTSGQMGLNYSW